jgi:UDP-glucose 4-epimerase
LILVTGGAGYIGSILVEMLLAKEYPVVVIDNLQQGHRAAVLPGARFIQADVANIRVLDALFSCFKVDAVMHLAADSIVSKSMSNPQLAFSNNISNGIILLNTMIKHDVKKLIFSSSAAVYGQPCKVPIMEDHPLKPVNPYGETKLIFEKILHWYGKAYGLKHISLRYFNAAGASEKLGEDHLPETHLIPNALKAVLNPELPLKIFGNDYPTQDGSCIRDYIHVIYIARAHTLALEKIDDLTGRAYNLGNGNGYSVLEVVKAVEEICGIEVPVVISPCREGDPSTLTASAGKARVELDWEPQCPDLKSIIGSAWRWIQSHSEGYLDSFDTKHDHISQGINGLSF